MTNVKEAALIVIGMGVGELAIEEGLTLDKVNLLRKDAGVIEYYRLRDEDETGKSLLSDICLGCQRKLERR